MRAREVEKMLLKDGWYFVKQVGSHKQFKHPTKKGKVTLEVILTLGPKNQYLNRQGFKSPLPLQSSSLFFRFIKGGCLH